MIRMAPGAIPMVARTDGNDKMPKDIVSAIMTVERRLDSATAGKM
jgi:hypothetical protein